MAAQQSTDRSSPPKNLAYYSPPKIDSAAAEPTPERLIMKFKKVVSEAYPPTKGAPKAAGYDLRSAYDCVIAPRDRALVTIGLKIELPTGYYGRIAPRSGLAAKKNFIDVGAGVIDEDYRGVVHVLLFNHSDNPFLVRSGDRIAQLICERIYYPDLEEIEDLSTTDRVLSISERDLSTTDRGEAEFGSSCII